MCIWGPDGAERRRSVEWTPPAWLAWMAAFALVALFAYAFDDGSAWPGPATQAQRDRLLAIEHADAQGER